MRIEIPFCRMALGLLVLTTPIFANEKSAEVIADNVYLKAQHLVAVETHRRLNIYCTGNGSPTVIFDSGLGDRDRVWGLVQPAIAAETRACSYDRAGLGFSDPSPKPRTSTNIVDDLHRLLQAAHIKPPYVLVGHSLGGMNIKLYAETYPWEVVGMVFVDPSDENQGKRFWALDSDAQMKYASSLKDCASASRRCHQILSSDQSCMRPASASQTPTTAKRSTRWRPSLPRDLVV